MKHLKNILLIIVPLVLLFLIVLIFFSQAINQLNLNSQEETFYIRVGGDSNSFYLKTKAYGIAGDHEQIVLSKSRNSVPTHKDDYFFYTTQIFYKVEKNILYIYAPKSSISEPIMKAPNVIIKELETYDEIRDYSNHYSSYGLERISIYK